MTPQGNFMILAPIVSSREAELRGLLDSMNEAPGSVNPNNPLVPFAQFDTLHFARFVILDDKTVGDLRIYGLPVRTHPLYLAFLGDIDGEEEAFLNELVRRASDGLRAIFSCCHGFASNTDLMAWMKLLRSPASAVYVNTRGRTVRRIREEAALEDAIESHLASQASSFEGLPAREIHAQLKRFVEAEKSAGRLTLSDEEATPPGWLDQKNVAPDLHALVGVTGFAVADSDRSILSLSASPPGEDRSGALHRRRRRPLRDLGGGGRS